MEAVGVALRYDSRMSDAPETTLNRQPLTITPRGVLIVLLVVDVALFILHVLGRWVFFTRELGPVSGHLVRLFDMGGEATIPTWISIVQLLTAAALLLVISLRVRVSGGRRWRHWALLGIIFTYISLDEQAEIHEIFVLPLQQLLGITTGPFLLAWVIPALILLAALSVAYIPFFRDLPRKTFLIFLAAAVIYVAGAAGLEMVDAVTYETLRDLGTRGAAIKAALYGVEELLELLGVTAFIYGLLLHLRDSVPLVTGVTLSR